MDLNIFSDSDGYPWCAFVWGKVNPGRVADLITVEEVEDKTGFDAKDLRETHVDWPPEVTHFYMRPGDDDECNGDFDEIWFICDSDHPDARIVTGHKFNP